MKSLKDNKTEQEYLWQADPKFWGRTSPVLFPIVGNYAQKQSVYEGKTYTLSQHGFARDMEFDLESQTEEEIWFVLKDTESTLEKYPFHFILKVGYRLSGRQVEVMWKVENPNDKKMYFSIGGHPAFNCPLKEGEKQELFFFASFSNICNRENESQRKTYRYSKNSFFLFFIHNIHIYISHLYSLFRCST